MKKILIVILAALVLIPATLEAKKAKKDYSMYLTGAVPEKDGRVVFSKTFKIPGKSEADLKKEMMVFVKDSLVGRGIQDPWNRMLTDETCDTLICARVEEWMVFVRKFLYLDQTRFRYQINVRVNNNSINMEICQISYLYGEEWVENKPTGNGGEIYRAEDWITDKNALNKKGTKMLPQSGKFRRKTVDRCSQIFNMAMDMFETKAAAEEAAKASKPEVKKRKFVEE